MKALYTWIFGLIFVAAFSLTACQRSDDVEAARDTDRADRAMNLTEDEKEFVKYAAEMHTGEIKLAELAKQKSSSEDVKNYADAVIDVHTDALKDLSDRVGQQQTTNASLDTENHSKYLSPLSGAKFDQEFIALMIADHKDAANTFSDQLGKVQNKELTSYMKEVQPSLEKSLSEAQEVQQAVTTAKSR